MSNQIRILCVDDERNVLRALERIFLDDDYEILTACSGEEGLELLDAAQLVQVVISDFRMPGMNGVEFLKEVFKKRPETIRIVLSGYADTAAVVAAINDGKIYKFIPKPWNDDELRLTVAKALETFAIQRKNLQLAEELRLKNEELSELNTSLEQKISERTCELLLQNRALLHATNVLNHLPVGVVGLSREGVVLQLNREAALLLGIPPDRVLGKEMAELLPPEICSFARGVCAEVCGCQTLTLRGIEVQIKGSTVVEEEGAGVILTMIRTVAAG
jgi:FixJ family two-component response regulator